MVNIDIKIGFDESRLYHFIKFTAYNENNKIMKSHTDVVCGIPTPTELSYYYRDFIDLLKVISHSADYGMIVKETANNEE